MLGFLPILRGMLLKKLASFLVPSNIYEEACLRGLVARVWNVILFHKC